MNDYNFYGDIRKKFSTIKSKDDYIRYHIREKFTKTIRMFEYKVLPDTITARDLELGLQYNGYMIALKHQGKFYILYGSIGGEMNQNYMPTIAVVANPYLNLSKTFKIDEDCVVIPNDSMYRGLLPLHAYYAQKDAECDISLNAVLRNTRVTMALVAKDSSTLEDCKQFISDMDEGKTRPILDKTFDGELKSLGLGDKTSTQTIIQLLEAIQYNKGSWWNEVGVQSNYNMKRETITANENILNVDSLLPRIDDMYECRKTAFEKIKNMFGVDIIFDYSSSWKKLRKEIIMTEQEIKPINEQSNKLENSDVSNKLENEKNGEKNETDKDN